MSFSPIVPGIAAAVLYLAGTWLQGRALAHNASLPAWALRVLVLPALALHAIAAYGILATPQGINLSLVSVTSVTALMVLAMVVAAGVARPVHSLFVLLFPLAASRSWHPSSCSGTSRRPPA